MVDVTISGLAWVDVSSYDLDRIDKIKKSLTLKPQRTHQKQTEEQLAPIELFRQKEQLLGVPREYFMKHRTVEHRPVYRVSPGRPWAFRPQSNPKYAMRDDQPDAIRAAFERLKPPFGGCIIQAPTGWGKTIVATEIARQIALLTVILVPTTKLLDQWIESINDYLGGQLRVGVLQQDRYDIDCDIIVGMMDSMVDRNHVELYENAGFVIGDEVHHMGARGWGSLIPRFMGPFRLGLSARPSRKDRLDRSFFDHIGPKVFSAKIRRMRAHVHFVRTGWRLIKTPAIDPEEVSDGMVMRFLCSSKPRNELIVKTLVRALEKGRKIIVFSDRRAHLDKLREAYAGVKPPGKTDGFLRGNMSRKDQKISDRCDVIWATYSFVKEGYSNDDIDTVFLATPVSDPEQPVGRGLRWKDGKKDVIVVDFDDDGPELIRRRKRSRLKVYQKIDAILPDELDGDQR